MKAARNAGALPAFAKSTAEYVFPTDLLAWPACPPVTSENPLSYWWPVDALSDDACTADSAAPIEITTPKTGRGSFGAPANWKDDAKAIAMAYIKKHKEMDLHPSLRDVSGHTATEMRNQKIYGLHGKPLSAGTVTKEALQGQWWQENG